jgi:hypothetical protein
MCVNGVCTDIQAWCEEDCAHCVDGKCESECSPSQCCSNDTCVSSCPSGCCENGACVSSCTTGCCENGTCVSSCTTGCCENGACVSSCTTGCCENGACVSSCTTGCCENGTCVSSCTTGCCENGACVSSCTGGKCCDLGLCVSECSAGKTCCWPDEVCRRCTQIDYNSCATTNNVPCPKCKNWAWECNNYKHKEYTGNPDSVCTGGCLYPPQCQDVGPVHCYTEYVCYALEDYQSLCEYDPIVGDFRCVARPLQLSCYECYRDIQDEGTPGYVPSERCVY